MSFSASWGSLTKTVIPASVYNNVVSNFVGKQAHRYFGSLQITSRACLVTTQYRYYRTKKVAADVISAELKESSPEVEEDVETVSKSIKRPGKSRINSISEHNAEAETEAKPSKKVTRLISSVASPALKEDSSSNNSRLKKSTKVAEDGRPALEGSNSTKAKSQRGRSKAAAVSAVVEEVVKPKSRGKMIMTISEQISSKLDQESKLSAVRKSKAEELEFATGKPAKSSPTDAASQKPSESSSPSTSTAPNATVNGNSKATSKPAVRTETVSSSSPTPKAASQQEPKITKDNSKEGSDGLPQGLAPGVKTVYSWIIDPPSIDLNPSAPLPVHLVDSLSQLLYIPIRFKFPPWDSSSHLISLENDSLKSKAIILCYSKPLQIKPPNSSEPILAQVGYACSIISVTRNKESYLESDCFPYKRVYRPVGSAEDVKWEELPDIQTSPEILHAALLACTHFLDSQAAAQIRLILATALPVKFVVDLAFNLLAESALSSRIPSLVLPDVEAFFVETNIQRKEELVKSAIRIALESTDLAHSIELGHEKKRIKQLEMFMEKQLRSTLKSDMESDMLQKIQALPEEPRDVGMHEFEWLRGAEQSSNSESTAAWTYLEWLTALPWTQKTVDNFDMKRAKEIFDKNHLGMEELKTKILTLLANGSRTSTITSKPLLFVGPPGSGKTSFAKSIAEALGRKFIVLSGLHEGPDIKGFKRSYYGSVPGMILSEIRKCGSRNPVIVIDEIDKINMSFTWKPIYPTLLELLSVEQNKKFVDSYLEVPFDLSDVLFVCTANAVDKLRGPLRSRLERFDLRSYTIQEKLDIMKTHLIPQELAEAGLTNVSLEENAIQNLIQVYNRNEAGIRQARFQLATILRQIALKAVESGCDDPKSFPYTVKASELSQFLGAPDPKSAKIYSSPPPGVVHGLSTSIYGGNILSIEVIPDTQHEKTSRPSIDFTGNIKETMNDSSIIALNYAKSFLSTFFPSNDFLETTSLHLHAPSGATPKDGPSAGCALTSAYVSLALGKPIRPSVCMTGAITLSGKVTAVGGILEKVTAASQANMQTVILPKTNQSDFEAIPKHLLGSIQPFFVSHYEEAFEHIFQERLNPVAPQEETPPLMETPREAFVEHVEPTQAHLLL